MIVELGSTLDGSDVGWLDGCPVGLLDGTCDGLPLGPGVVGASLGA